MSALNQINSRIVERRSASLAEGVYLSLPRLSELFGLNPFEERSLVICLAPEIDRSYEKLYAYLQDDVTRKKPSVDLLMNLLLSTMSPIDCGALGIRASISAPQIPPVAYVRRFAGPIPLISRFLKLDDRIVDFLLGSDRIDARLGAMARIPQQKRAIDSSRSAESRCERIRNSCARTSATGHSEKT